MPPRSRTLLIGYQPWFRVEAEKGYTFLMRRALAAFGHVVGFDGVVATWRVHRRRLDFLVLNWTDNDLLDRRTRRIAPRKVVRVFARTIALRLAARKLVFVRHNVYPHAVAAGHEANARRWVDRYERLFDVVLTHSGDDGQKPRRYCPHPLFPRVSPVSRPSWLPERYVVVFGRIVRYKRLERLLDAFPDDGTLVIAGAVGDRAYADELAQRRRPNVVFRPGLIDEADAQAIVAGSDALLIAHADGDVIVSASFYFAMSLGVPVLAVETPFLRWIAPRVGPALLRLAGDVEALCATLRERPFPPVDDAARDAIEREFGDATVHAALAAALGLDGATLEAARLRKPA